MVPELSCVYVYVYIQPQFVATLCSANCSFSMLSSMSPRHSVPWADYHLLQTQLLALNHLRHHTYLLAHLRLPLSSVMDEETVVTCITNTIPVPVTLQRLVEQIAVVTLVLCTCEKLCSNHKQFRIMKKVCVYNIPQLIQSLKFCTYISRAIA